MTEDSEYLARLFHETYERLAPKYSYKTRKSSAVPWKDVPQGNKNLMIAVAEEILQEYCVREEYLGSEFLRRYK